MGIGVDPGGSKTEAIALSDEAEVRAWRSRPGPRGDDNGTPAARAVSVAGLGRQSGCQGCGGVGIPAALSPAGGLVNTAPADWLVGRLFDRDMGAALPSPVRAENAAYRVALSAAVDGSGAGEVALIEGRSGL